MTVPMVDVPVLLIPIEWVNKGLTFLMLLWLWKMLVDILSMTTVNSKQNRRLR